jgi:hypothetical protein
MRVNLVFEELRADIPLDFGEVNTIAPKGGYDKGFVDGEAAGRAEGYREGYAEGEKVSYDVGYNKGFEDGGKESFELGKKAQYDEFWDTYQRNGTRKVYYSAFKYWRPAAFAPKYDLRPTNASSMFESFGAQEFAEKCDLVERLAECGITLDTSQCENLDTMFYSSYMTRIGTIDARGTTKSLSGLFYNMYYLETIEKFIIKEDGTTVFTNTTIYSCSKLKNLTIEGVIGTNGLYLSNCKQLTHDSLMSVINALQDKTTDTSGTTWKITLGSDNIAKLTEDELEIIEKKGWQVK